MKSEKIDFGNDIWQQVEEYVGKYEISDEDLWEMKNGSSIFQERATAMSMQRVKMHRKKWIPIQEDMKKLKKE